MPEFISRRLPVAVSGLGSWRPTDWLQNRNLLASLNLWEITHHDDGEMADRRKTRRQRTA